MAVEWFYTTNKQQMGPVTWTELVELAQGGILKPHDLVWTEGMGEWVKAIHQQGLFVEGDEESGRPAKKSAYTKAKPPPGRRTSRPDDDEDEDEEDDRETRRKARKREEDRARTGVGIKVGLILAGVLVVLLFLACGGGVIIWITFAGGRGGAPQNAGPRRESFTVNNLPMQKQSPAKAFVFNQGKHVTITCTNTVQFANTDVDLYVFRGANGPGAPAELPFRSDIRVPQQDRNCRIEFDVPANDTYRIIVVNLGPGMARSCVVNIEER